MIGLLSIFCAIASLLLPNRVLLVVVIPVLIVLSGYMKIIAPVLEIGDKPVHVYDVIILVLIFKLFARFCLTGFRLDAQLLHRRIGLYLGVLFGATLLAYFRMGPVIFQSELIAYLRFVMMASIFFLIYYSESTVLGLQEVDRLFRVIGLAVSLSVYLSIFLFLMTGYHFGEVQDTRGIVRYFGPLGDQVGFIIALFCFRELLAGRTLFAVFHGAAIFATGTRGALLTLFIGLLLVYAQRRRVAGQSSSVPWGKVVTVVLVIVLIAGFGSKILTRLIDPGHLSQGLTQRTLSMGLGVNVFLSNMLTGVGYSGFRFAALGYNPETLFPAFNLNVITNTSNQFIQVATDAGIAGLTAFLLLMKSCYDTLKGSAELATAEVRATLGGGCIWLVALLIGNQTAVWLIQGSIITYFFWILMALAAVNSRFHRFDKRGIISEF